MAFHFLLFDIGNSNIKTCVAELGAEQGVCAEQTLSTPLCFAPGSSVISSEDTGVALRAGVAELLERHNIAAADIRGGAVCSVNPQLEPVVAALCRELSGSSPLFAGRDLAPDLENLYHSPSELGADRLLSSYAARRLFPEPECLVVVDFGTATTFECVRREAYLGGLICPGVAGGAQFLSERTAMLPLIDVGVDMDAPLIGRSTLECMQSGVMYGAAAMVEGVCARLENEMETEALFVVAAGGLARKMGALCPRFDAVRPYLLLEGLKILSEIHAKA